MRRPSSVVLRPLLLVALAVAGLAAEAAAQAAPTPKRPASPAAPPPGTVTINAYDYFYEAPNPIAGGVVTFRLVNRGQDFHNIWIVKIDEGYAFSDFMRAMGPGRPLPSWFTPLGGPESPEPGQESRLTVELPPGRYAIACLLPASAHGTTHMAKGMFLPLTVTKASARSTPKGDVPIRITNDGFVAPEAVTAGTHLMHVFSESSSPRGFRLARLADGRTAADAKAWIAAGQTGPAPFVLVGGTTPMAQGGTVWMPASFASGRYVLLPMGIDLGSGELRYQPGAVATILVP